MRENEAQARLLSALSRHVGVEKALGMAELFELVFNRQVKHRINDTRRLRTLITRLRLDGAAIASVTRPDGGGYYLAAAGSELEDYLSRLHRRGLAALRLEACLRKISLTELLSRVGMETI
ncbi:MAG: hypothetical protein V1816_27925 [Pseudomonadota bacterium]